MLPLFEQNCDHPAKRLKASVASDFMGQLSPGWEEEHKTLVKTFPFTDYDRSIAFVNEVARIAAIQNHHPDMLVSFKSVRVLLTTHDAGEISLNDLIMAAKIDKI